MCLKERWNVGTVEFVDIQNVANSQLFLRRSTWSRHKKIALRYKEISVVLFVVFCFVLLVYFLFLSFQEMMSSASLLLFPVPTTR